jgi:transcriptional regulator with XRE-family HTH domain/DNA-directed RNA polymerase subunit RPC12/RpoP
MDQIKIGKFIKELRRDQGLTQAELAEKLCVSDKTISKWETGNGLPEVSLMLPLCETLAISVNELLSGRRLEEKQYYQEAEKNIMDLMEEKKKLKKKFWFANIVCIAQLFVGLSLMCLAATLEMETWLRITLIALGFVVIAIVTILATMLDLEIGSFECAKCGHHFQPTTSAYINGPHTPTKRYMKCPKCNKRSWCKKSLEKAEKEN